MPARRRIHLDLDGAVIDTVSSVLRVIDAEDGTGTSAGMVLNWDFSPALLSPRRAYRAFKERAADVWGEARPYPGAAAFYRRLREMAQRAGVPLLLTTSLSSLESGELEAKIGWVGLHLGRSEIGRLVFCNGNKADLFGAEDVVIEDSPKVLAAARAAGAAAIGIARGWNRAESNPPWDGGRYDYDGALEAVGREIG